MNRTLNSYEKKSVYNINITGSTKKKVQFEKNNKIPEKGATSLKFCLNRPNITSDLFSKYQSVTCENLFSMAIVLKFNRNQNQQ